MYLLLDDETHVYIYTRDVLYIFLLSIIFPYDMTW